MTIRGNPARTLIATLLGPIMAFAVVAETSGCGGGRAADYRLPTPPTTAAVSVTISPKSVSNLPAGATQSFTATVTGSNNQAVTWSVEEGAACGSVTNVGNYVAPNSPGLVCHVTVTSEADTTKSDTATVSISSITMYVLPFQVSLGVGQMQTFATTVQGTTNTAVKWSVEEGLGGGSITNQGVYTAPQTLGTFHVIATSQADTRFTASSEIDVVSVAVAISPQADTLGLGGVRQFSATATITDQAVLWAVEEGPAGGSVTSTGVYTAPQTLGTFHVVAASVEDPTRKAIATVTIVQAGFAETGSMSTGRQSHAATLLADGRVLITGGEGEQTSDCGCGPTFASAEIYDPGTGTFGVTGSMTAERAFHTATLLQSGKVLVAGGSGGSGWPATEELFDPLSGTFSAVGSMTTPRTWHTATLLRNGKVLIAGGNGATAELFDPASGTFAATGSMSTPRRGHTATLMPSGKVLIAGGTGDSGPMASAEIFDPASGTFTSTTGTMTTARTGQTATLLETTPNGRVLIAGGSDASGPLKTAETFDPVSGSFTLLDNMTAPRAGHTAALLPNGAVLIAGGADLNNFGLPGFTAELFEPLSSTFTATGGMVTPRMFHTATLLGNGEVLVVGGLIDDVDVTAAAEIYR